MASQTPIDRAVATYCSSWQTTYADCEGVARINPEMLAERTAGDLTFRYIDIGSVDRGRIDWATVDSLRFEDAPSRARRVVRPGDTLISTVRPLLGSHAYADWDEASPTVGSTGFAVLRCQEGLLPNFVKHLPFAEQVTRQLVAWQCGTSYPAVNERDIRHLVLPVPSRDEQSAIARILDAIDHTRDEVREAAHCARAVEKAVVADALSSVDAEWRRLGDVAVGFRYGTSQASNDHGSGNPVLRIPNVIGDRLRLDDLEFTKLPSADVERLRLRNGDLLVVRTNGNPNYVGRSVVFHPPDAGTWLFASYLIRVRLVPEMSPDYVNVVLGTSRGRQDLLRRVTTSAGNHNINANSLRRLTVPVPRDKADQHRIVALALACRNNVDALSAKADALARLKQSVMADLLTGRMRVADAAVAVTS